MSKVITADNWQIRNLNQATSSFSEKAMAPHSSRPRRIIRGASVALIRFWGKKKNVSGGVQASLLGEGGSLREPGEMWGVGRQEPR